MAEGKRVKLKKKKAPCLGCGMRFPGCHAVCIRFGVWRAGMDAMTDDIRAEKKKHSDVTKVINHGFEQTRYAQMIKKRGRGK